MVVLKRIQKSVTIASAVTVGTITFDPIYGEIYKVEVVNDTGSCGWWIYLDASADGGLGEGGNLFDENIIGATGVGHIDTAGAVYYPVVAQVVSASAATTDPDQYALKVVGGSIVVDIDDAAAGEICTVAIWYKPQNNVY